MVINQKYTSMILEVHKNLFKSYLTNLEYLGERVDGFYALHFLAFM